MNHEAEAHYRATVHYDGSGFSGWQVQPDERTVQGELEARLSRLGMEGRVSAAGRTDAGVHATGQEIGFASPRAWDSAELQRALNSTLPDDIWIESLDATAPGFHPRFQATGRRYEYYLAPGPAGRSPHRRRGAWSVESRLDDSALRESARRILGDGDFALLSKAGQPDLGTRCVIEKAQWAATRLGDLRLTLVADRFLHRMVRYLVATMVEIATDRRHPDELVGLLRGDQSMRAPVPAPACGLYLTGVRYPEGWNRAPGVPGLWP